MKPCPGCLGDGELDCRDLDAALGEHFGDVELAEMRDAGLVHPVGVIVCGECNGTKVVTDERAEELHAEAVVAVERAMAKVERDDHLQVG